MANQPVIICRCEEVTDKMIRETAQKYQCSSREVKLRTRAAMGYCGGRTCRYLVDQMLSDLSGRPAADDIPLRYRPPVRPVPFKTIGGEPLE